MKSFKKIRNFNFCLQFFIILEVLIFSVLPNCGIAATHERPKKILELARKEFDDLYKSETDLFRAAEIGKMVDFSSKIDGEDDPEKANAWGKNRTLRASRIAWLCSNAKASQLVTHKGILIKGARIDEELDLKFAKIPFPMLFKRCAFTGDINLIGARLKALYLNGSHCSTILADALDVEGELKLSRGFKSHGKVSIIQGKIGTNLECDGGHFLNKGGVSLNANGLNVKGSVLMEDGFSSEGEVNLLGAMIEGNLECEGGRFTNQGAISLQANSIRVMGGIFLRNGFKSDGEVNLIRAQIGNDLDCINGQFLNNDGMALNAAGMNVKGNVFMDGEFRAEGGVLLIGAKIGGNLECDGAKFVNKRGETINGNSMNIQGNIFLRNGFKSEGEVYLVNAFVGGSIDCQKGTFLNSGHIALTCDGIKVVKGIIFSEDFEAKGKIVLIGANFNLLKWMKIKLDEELILDLRYASVNTIIDDQESWPNKGNLLIDGFTYINIGDQSPTDLKNRIEWIRRQPKGRFTYQPYEQFASFLLRNGREEEAKKVQIIKNEDRASSVQLTPYEWFWYRLFGPMIGYGYRPLFALWIGLSFIIVGCFIFYLGYQKGLINPLHRDAVVSRKHDRARKLTNEYPTFNPLIYSIDMFIPFINLYQGNYWLPNTNKRAKVQISKKFSPSISGRFIIIYMWIHILAGWLLTTLIVLGVTGLMRT